MAQQRKTDRLYEALKHCRLKNHLVTKIQDLEVRAYNHQPDAAFKCLIIGGIHGNEPAGIYATLQLMSAITQIPSTLALTIIPCLNPVGFNRNKRHNEDQKDLNRAFGISELAEERKIIDRLLSDIDLLITLHEDDVHDGCYLYESAPSKIGSKVIKAMSEHCKVCTSDEVFGEPCAKGIITSLDHTKPKTKYSIEGRATSLNIPNYCLETPKAEPFDNRLLCHVAGVKAILESYDS